MLKATKSQSDQATSFSLEGVVDETADFDKLFGTFTGELIVNCSKVSRISSAGVRNWVHYFKRMVTGGKKFRVTECSPSVVELLNLTGGAIPKDAVESALLPFYCSACKQESHALYKVTDLIKLSAGVPPGKCPRCGGVATFDDIPTDYFRFAFRNSPA